MADEKPKECDYCDEPAARIITLTLLDGTVLDSATLYEDSLTSTMVKDDQFF